jgi:hypothetical protein
LRFHCGSSIQGKQGSDVVSDCLSKLKCHSFFLPINFLSHLSQ